MSLKSIYSFTRLQTDTIVKIACVVVILIFNQSSFAQTSAGISLGSPTGFSVLQETSKTRALEGVVGWSASDLTIIGNYLVVDPQKFRLGGASSDFYYGFGLRLSSIDGGKNDGQVSISPRFPIGIKHRFSESRFEVFGELSININLSPGTGLDLDVGLGVRYRF
ncbi:MAG: hypothetical protein LW875_03670 [Proteobacteria bacterium]|jgi:hypothetical protein|nr:hypothetical protein [Pseudomonadota bacterium]